MKLILAALTVSVSGCSTLGPSADQIKQMANTSSSFCVEAGPSLYGPAVSAHYSSFGGKSVGTGGGGGNAQCGKSSVTFENEGRATNIPDGYQIVPGPNGTFVLTPKPTKP